MEVLETLVKGEANSIVPMENIESRVGLVGTSGLVIVDFFPARGRNEPKKLEALQVEKPIRCFAYLEAQFL